MGLDSRDVDKWAKKGIHGVTIYDLLWRYRSRLIGVTFGKSWREIGDRLSRFGTRL